ncbi:hypothetical protein [Aliikangiella maris]|uniref:Uncharacterized protein n=2 Tax=Aliikangiella maris TaxID=3162458 RepID=A0ABV2BNQ1_9GAMM
MSQLEKEDLIALSRNGEQLKNVFRHLIKEFPQSACSISGMSKWLGINRSNSQRVLNAVNRSHNGFDVICMLPGVAGVQEFVEQCRKKKLSALYVKEASKALETFQDNIKNYSRSHSELKRMIQDAASEVGQENTSASSLHKRQRYYQSISELIGEKADVLFAAYVLRVNAKRSDYLHETALVSKQGISHTSSARPFFQYYAKTGDPVFKEPHILGSKDNLPKKNFGAAIVENFSSPKLIKGYSGYSQKHECLVFNNVRQPQEPFDATFLFSNPDAIQNPLNSDTHSSSTAISIKNPTKRLIMMVFMERQLDIRSTVNVGCYSGNHLFEGDLSLDEIWDDKLPEFPELKIINLDSPVAEESDGLKYGHLNDYMFEMSGLDKKDFVCYMLDVSYPIWSSCYRIYFEHC